MESGRCAPLGAMRPASGLGRRVELVAAAFAPGGRDGLDYFACGVAAAGAPGAVA